MEDDARMQVQGQPVDPSQPAEQSREQEPAKLEVVLSRDGLEAYVQISASRMGAMVTEQDIESALRQAGVVFGYNDPLIRRQWLTGNVMGLRRFLAARGTPPRDGNDGRVEYLFTLPEKKRRVQESVDGTVDFYNLGLIENVEAGQVLARLVPPTKGVPGKSVLGKEIPARDGKPARLSGGTNTKVSEDGTELLATTAGEVRLLNGKVQVLPVHEVRGNVDFSTGNIDFNGNVVVHGNVAAGFRIQAGGSVQISGWVDAAEIVAGGDVTIRGGMQGNNKGSIRCGGTLTARFLEHAHVVAGRDVIIQEGIMFSHVDAGGSIICVSRKGQISGGLLRAVDRVEAKILGSRLASATEVQVGAGPELREERNRVTEALKEREAQLDQVEKGWARLNRARAQGAQLSPRELEILGRMDVALKSLRPEVEKLRQRKAELDEILSGADRGQVVVREYVRPGVRISIGGVSYIVEDELSHATFYVANGEIKVSQS